MRETYLTRTQAAKLLQVNPRTIDNWRKAGKLRGVAITGRTVRIPVSEIQRLMDQIDPLPFSVISQEDNDNGKG